MDTAYLSGFLALGTLTGSAFTEISIPNGSYQRQQVSLSIPVYGRTNVQPQVNFLETSGKAFGSFNAVAIYDAQTAGNLILTWRLAAPVVGTAYENINSQLGSLSFSFNSASGLAGATVPASFPSFAANTLVGMTTLGMPVYTGTGATTSGAGGGSGVTTIPNTVTAAGTTQNTATALTGLLSLVTSVPSGGGVMVANIINQMQTILNEDPANALKIYPLVGMTFVNTGLAQNAPFQIAPGKAVGIEATSATQALILFGSPSNFG